MGQGLCAVNGWSWPLENVTVSRGQAQLRGPETNLHLNHLPPWRMRKEKCEDRKGAARASPGPERTYQRSGKVKTPHWLSLSGSSVTRHNCKVSHLKQTTRTMARSQEDRTMRKTHTLWTHIYVWSLSPWKDISFLLLLLAHGTAQQLHCPMRIGGPNRVFFVELLKTTVPCYLCHNNIT